MIVNQCIKNFQQKCATIYMQMIDLNNKVNKRILKVVCALVHKQLSISGLKKSSINDTIERKNEQK